MLPFTDKEKLIEALLERVTEKDIVLVKASRGMRLEHVVDALKALPGGNNGVRGELMDFQLLLLTIGVAFVLAVISAPLLIPLLRRMKFGQQVRNDGPQSHLKSRNANDGRRCDSACFYTDLY